ncbi:hypothetical protein [Myroides odoratus]|uniref:hypothetical protein n=1 Tax=Myroides odoratus TaxID=256 RepID=UPI0039B0A98A
MKTVESNVNMPPFLLILFVIQFVLAIRYFIYQNDSLVLLLISTLVLIFGFFFTLSKLRVKIDDSVIAYSYFPFVNKKIPWKDVESIEVIKISPLKDFLGWGIRYSMKHGMGYILTSKYALFVKKKNGNKVTISINKNEEFIEYLNERQDKKVV